MAKGKANITVVTEVGYCPFCARTRNLRREERHLGGLVRTTIDCESCHRTLQSTIGPPQAEPEPAPAPEVKPEPEPAPVKAAPKAAAAKKAAKPAAKARPATARKPAATAKKSATKKK